MPKVSVILVIYNAKKYVKPVYDAIFAQTHPDLEVFTVVNGNADGAREDIIKNYPKVTVIDAAVNSWAASNNLAISRSTGEFVQLVNQDLVLEPTYIEEMLKAFVDVKVAAATGKLLRYDFSKNQKTQIIDTTGILLQATGRARDRGQNHIDSGQFDNEKEIFGVSGAAPMFRRSALEKVKYFGEFMDEDMVMYWEDVDLSWRLNNAGFKNVYVPTAVGYHGRTAGQSEGGYLHVFKFIQHHSKLSNQVLRWNYKNHILMYIKNAKHLWNPLFWGRELAMLGYVIIFETSTLKAVPELFQQLPKIWKKRQAQMKVPQPLEMHPKV